MISRGLTIHGAILAVAAGLAYHTWTYDESKAPKSGETDLWPGTPDQVQGLRFESKFGSLGLEPHHDTNGPYFVGVVKKVPGADKKPDEKAPASADPKDADKPAEPKTTQFIATKDGEDLIAQLAPLRALRVLGKVSEADKTDFGFDKDLSKLTLTEGGKDRTLIFGGSTPGGTDYYAKDATTGAMYVVSGSILRDLTSADQRLVERRLHAFEDNVPKRIKITAGTATRELVRSADKTSWTKPSAPNDKDETATNWLSKIDHVRTTSYEGDALHPPAAEADYVFKLEYFDDRKSLGFAEFIHRAAPDGKVDYVVRTELTRWYATVIRSQLEQIEQDVKSVVNP
jgi:hypothetical protein